MKTRTQDEILSRYNEVQSNDFFGFRREVLMEAMTADTLAIAIGVDKAEAEEALATVTRTLEERARGYLDFAVTKIVDHRGISASRSVEKLVEFAWLLGRDDVVGAMQAADFAQYGAPQVRAFAEGMGWPFAEMQADPRDREALERMSTGQSCVDDCDSGCDR